MLEKAVLSLHFIADNAEEGKGLKAAVKEKGRSRPAET
jgi:hypothetical protein